MKPNKYDVGNELQAFCSEQKVTENTLTFELDEDSVSNSNNFPQTMNCFDQ